MNDKDLIKNANLLLDQCENACVLTILRVFKTTEPFMSEAQARAIVARVGTRIAERDNPFSASQFPNK